MSRAQLRPALRMAARGARMAHASPAWWVVAGKTCVFAFQPKGAADYAASLVNLANPGTYDAEEGAAPDWDGTNGWGVGGGKYLTINPAPTVATAWTAIVRCTVTGATGRVFSVMNGGDQAVHGVAAVSASKWQLLSGNGSWSSGDVRVPGNDVWAVGAGEGYQNGTDIADIAASDITGTYIGIGANVLSWTVFDGPAATVQAVAMYSDTLTAPEVAALSAIMAAL